MKAVFPLSLMILLSAASVAADFCAASNTNQLVWPDGDRYEQVRASHADDLTVEYRLGGSVRSTGTEP